MSEHNLKGLFTIDGMDALIAAVTQLNTLAEKVIDLLEGQIPQPVSAAEEKVEAPKKKSRASVKASELEAEEEDDEESFDLEEEEAEEEKPRAKKLSLKKDILPALRAYIEDNSKADAAKLIKKLGVKSIQELPEGKYPALLELLS